MESVDGWIHRIDALGFSELTAGGWLAAGLLVSAAVLLGALVARMAAPGRRGSGELGRLTSQFADQQSFQAELAGRLKMLTEVVAGRQNDLAEALTSRVDGLTEHLGRSVTAHGQRTGSELAKIGERLAVIDEAQRALDVLSSQVVDLTSLLGDKQSRGIFGQSRMETILSDALPPGGYSFQATLSTGVRPDCLVHMPAGMPPIAIDAKFPLEAFDRLAAAQTPEEKKRAERDVRRDIMKHVGDIHDRYLITGETHDTALLFLPAESLYATLHDRFADVVQKAFRLRVVIVSPSLLILAVQVIQNVLRDHRVSAAAKTIRTEVGALTQDVEALGDAVAKLNAHYGQTGRDLDRINTLLRRIAGRGDQLESLQDGIAADELQASGDDTNADDMAEPLKSAWARRASAVSSSGVA